MAPSSTDYTFFSISPTTADLPTLALKHKILRLSALQLSPESFSSTYAAESRLSDSAWLSRLTIKGKTLFICSTKAADPQDEIWAAIVTLIGPITASTFTLPLESGNPPAKSDEVEERWQLSSLYTLPDHRGQSLGRRLCEYAIAELRTVSKMTELRIRLMIKPTNTVVINMYERMGFEHSGKVTLEEALTSNSEEDNLPSPEELNGEGEAAEALRGKFCTRVGLVMQKILLGDQ